MAESLPSPPRSRSPTPSLKGDKTNQQHLVSCLDKLLEQYLEALDEYTTLREQMSKLFTDGFMSLAHAQRTSNLGPGRRYGEDGYDGRMKASRRVKITCSEASEQSESKQSTKTSTSPSKDLSNRELKVDIVTRTATDGSYFTDRNQGDTSLASETKRDQPLPVSDGTVPKISPLEEVSNEQQPQPKQDPAYRDPLTWYGILVPPPLRQAQKSFSMSVEASIPKVLTAVDRLKTLELQIWDTRKKLGIDKTY